MLGLDPTLTITLTLTLTLTLALSLSLALTRSLLASGRRKPPSASGMKRFLSMSNSRT